MLKTLNRTDKTSMCKITDMLVDKKNSMDFDFSLQELLTILNNGLHIEDTIMYDEETGNIFIYEEATHSMKTNQNEINKFICLLVDKSIQISSDYMKEVNMRINTLTEDELKKLINIEIE